MLMAKGGVLRADQGATIDRWATVEMASKKSRLAIHVDNVTSILKTELLK